MEVVAAKVFTVVSLNIVSISGSLKEFRLYVIVGAISWDGTTDMQINTRRLRAGSYNFTVYRGRKVADNGKIIIR